MSFTTDAVKQGVNFKSNVYYYFLNNKQFQIMIFTRKKRVENFLKNMTTFLQITNQQIW